MAVVIRRLILWLNDLILWLNDVDWEDFIMGWVFPVVLVTLFSFLLGLGISALSCWCDPVRNHGLIIASWAFASVGGYAGIAVGHNWQRIVRWAKKKPAQIAPSDPILEAAKREVEAIAPEHPDA